MFLIGRGNFDVNGFERVSLLLLLLLLRWNDVRFFRLRVYVDTDNSTRLPSLSLDHVDDGFYSRSCSFSRRPPPPPPTAAKAGSFYGYIILYRSPRARAARRLRESRRVPVPRTEHWRGVGWGRRRLLCSSPCRRCFSLASRRRPRTSLIPSRAIRFPPLTSTPLAATQAGRLVGARTRSLPGTATPVVYCVRPS